MQDQEGDTVDTAKETLMSAQETSKDDEWTKIRDDDIMQQHSAIQAEEALKVPFVGDKEPVSSLQAEYQSGSPILLQKIKVLSEQCAAIRRTRGDGNCFFRSFMFAYLEHILNSQDQAEVQRVKANIEECKMTLLSLGYAEFTFEDFFALFIEQLESVLQGSEDSISHDELLKRSRDPSVSDYGKHHWQSFVFSIAKVKFSEIQDYLLFCSSFALTSCAFEVVMFLRFVTSGEIRKRSEFFEPFILGLTNSSVEQFCKSSVEPMGEESDHVHITALSDALGVPVRVVYLDRSSCENSSINLNHHDFVPTCGNVGNNGDSETINPFITLLYRPGHYDILYPK